MKTSTNEETRLQSAVIQEHLRRVGIDLDLRSYEFATFYADVVRGRFQIFTLTWTGGALVDPDMLRRVFHSREVPPTGFNRGYYKNPEVDRLIDRATTALEENERRHFYQEAQKLIAEDSPYIPIWHRTNAIVAQRTVDGLHVPPMGDFTWLKDVSRVSP
jgi:peptide/nickel transport system substrate-binding protein